MRRALCLLSLGTLLVMPAAAVAQSGPGNALGPLPQNTASVVTSTTSQPSAINTTTTAGTSSVSSTGILAIAVGAVIIIGGIAYYIWRDARRHAPVKHGVVAATASGSKPRPKQRKLSAAERKRRKRGRAR